MAKADAMQRADLGSANVLTPVRRSARKSLGGGATPDISQQLQASQWAYSPNAALLQGTGSEQAGDDGVAE